jgi:hypothetical protein
VSTVDNHPGSIENKGLGVDVYRIFRIGRSQQGAALRRLRRSSLGQADEETQSNEEAFVTALARAGR